MVKVELAYNPYLVETKILFNGAHPKINSLVERFQKQRLQVWLSDLPTIFHDEMNGYDFDLFFSGTRSDFESLQQVFREQQIAPTDVRIMMKNELVAAKEKNIQLSELLAWLDNSRNDYFDGRKFIASHPELKMVEKNLIAVGFPAQLQEFSGFSVTWVQTAEELVEANLVGQPIVFYIDNQNSRPAALRQELQTILQRSDVQQQQLFFQVVDIHERQRIVRVIQDLGVMAPSLILDNQEASIINYYEAYPLMEYLHQAIGVLRDEFNQLTITLESAKKQTMDTNSRLQDQLEVHEKRLDGLKLANEAVIDRDSLELPKAFDELTVMLNEKILQWRNRKIKMTKEIEAQKEAVELVSFVQQAFETFLSQTKEVAMKCAQAFQQQFAAIYQTTGMDVAFQPENPFQPDISSYLFPMVAEDFMQLTTHEAVKEQSAFTSLSGLWKKEQPTEDLELLTMVTVYEYQRWREAAQQSLQPLTRQVVADFSALLQATYEELGEIYHEHLNELIRNEKQAKLLLSQQLNTEELRVQRILDWSRLFADQLCKVERE